MQAGGGRYGKKLGGKNGVRKYRREEKKRGEL
jgi:hypothetical protein